MVSFTYVAKEWAEDRQTSPVTLMATDHRVLNAEPLGDGGPGVEMERETPVRKQVDKEKRKWKIDSMPREARHEVPGVLHHTMIWGIEHRKIFIHEAS